MRVKLVLKESLFLKSCTALKNFGIKSIFLGKKKKDMEQHEKVLSAFATHTRHTDDEKRDTTQIAQKWLAVQSPNAEEVYSFSGQRDFAMVAARTHSPALSSYARSLVDIPTFQWVCARLGDFQSDAFDKFVQTYFPRPIGEEAWVAFEPKHVERRERERAVFLACALCKQKPNFGDLLRASQVPESTIEKLRRLKEPVVDARELGRILGTLRPVDCDVCKSVATEDPLDEEKVELNEPLQMKFVANAAESPAVDWHQLAEHALVQSYMKRNLLPPTTSPEKAVKQMLLVSLNLPCPSSLMVRTQKTPVAAEKEEVWRFVQTNLPQLRIDEPDNEEWWKSRDQWESATQYAHSLVGLYLVGPEPTDRYAQRYLQRYPNAPIKLQEAILKIK